MNAKEISHAIMELVSTSIMNIVDSQVEQMIAMLMSAKRVFVAGSGRSGLAGKAFASRILDLGFDVYVVGETITPSASCHDAIVAISGSGETAYTLNAAEVGKSLGAKVIGITSFSDSSLGKLSDLCVHLRGRIPAETSNNIKDYLSRQITGVHEPFTVEGVTFEVACMVFLESVVMLLKDARERKELAGGERSKEPKKEKKKETKEADERKQRKKVRHETKVAVNYVLRGKKRKT